MVRVEGLLELGLGAGPMLVGLAIGAAGFFPVFVSEGGYFFGIGHGVVGWLKRKRASEAIWSDETAGAVGSADSFGMSIIAAIFIGLIVGIVAKLLTPGRDPGGWIVTILIGLAGSVVAGYLGRGLGWYQEGEPVGFIASVVGAIILLVLYRLIARRR